MDTVVRARRAELLLSDEVFKAAHDVVYQRCVGVFTHPTSSQDEIMEASRIVRSLSMLTDALQSFADEAKMFDRQVKKGSAP
jgi:hypothetical protein